MLLNIIKRNGCRLLYYINGHTLCILTFWEETGITYPLPTRVPARPDIPHSLSFSVTHHQLSRGSGGQG